MLVLDLHNLIVSFQNKDEVFTAVKGINLQINRSEIHALIGESGSGKSVASQSLSRLIPEAKLSGHCYLTLNDSRVDLLNVEATVLRSIRKNNIAYIFQEPMTALNPLIRCGKQIEECLKQKNDVEQQLKSLLDKVELHEHERMISAYPHELSGGQRQRIMIAMALAKQPNLLIADEPTTALDIAVQQEILQLLRKLAKEEELAVLFITHDLLSLKNFADSISVMYKGEIVESNTADSILTKAQHPYTKALIESRANYSKKGYRLAEINDLLVTDDNHLLYKDPVLVKTNERNSESNEAIITVNGLYKSHYSKSLFKKHETTVLKDIDFQLFEGDSLGLIGESGSGKSTIAKILLKIWKQSKGQISVYGEPLNQLKDLPKLIQLVFQDPYSSLNPKHKIGASILEVLNTSRLESSKQACIELLQMVGLDETAYNKYPHEFSGGQRQRICIAKALAKDPKILILDEAVSALDVSVQAKVLNLLQELKVKKNLTYLLISHDMNVVSYFCNRILVLKDGEIQDYGFTSDLIDNPSSEYTKSLLQHSIY